LAKRLGVEAVVAITSFAANLDEPRPEKNAQVLRDGWPSHGKGRGNAAHGKFASAEEIEYAPARGIVDSGEYVTRRSRPRPFHGRQNR
jgi:hypothetical protein